MFAFALTETCQAAVCWFNSLNHARDKRHLERIFSCVARHLAPLAPFLFDVIPEQDYVRSWKISLTLVWAVVLLSTFHG